MALFDREDVTASGIVGVAIDVSMPAGGFATAGLAGLAAALTGYLLSRRSTARTGFRSAMSAPPGQRTDMPRSAAG